MSDTTRQAAVFVREKHAGMIRETDEGYSFAYDPEYLENTRALPVSITMPLRKEEYKSAVLFPFFDGLIPEGWLLNVAVRNWKLDRNDRFGLLLVCCSDCIGDVSIREVSDEVQPRILRLK